MKLSEVPIETVAVGDRLVSAVGNTGTIVGIYPEGSSSPFRGKVSTDLGSAEILIVWDGTRNWSLYEHAQLDRIDYDQAATDAHRASVAARG